MMVVHPMRTPAGRPLVLALERAIREVLGRDGELVASPGTYDHKHVARIAGVPHCVAYGPGVLELAHQPDEYCAVADLAASIQVLALRSWSWSGSTGGRSARLPAESVMDQNPTRSAEGNMQGAANGAQDDRGRGRDERRLAGPRRSARTTASASGSSATA